MLALLASVSVLPMTGPWELCRSFRAIHKFGSTLCLHNEHDLPKVEVGDNGQPTIACTIVNSSL